MLNPERFSSDSLAMLLRDSPAGVSHPIYSSAPGGPERVVANFYHCPEGYFVTGNDYRFVGKPLGYVVEMIGYENYNSPGLRRQERIFRLATLELAAAKLSYLILGRPLVTV